MKICSDCHAEVETGWQYCHTCGAVSHTTVYAIAPPGETAAPPPATETSSPFVAMLEGRPTTPPGQVFHEVAPLSGTDADFTPAVAHPVVTATVAAVAPPPVIAQLAPAPHPARAGLSARSQLVAAAVTAVALLLLTGLTVQLRAELGATRARLDTVEEQLGAAR